MRDPVALIAVRSETQLAGEADGRLLDVMLRPERACTDAQLIAGGEAPGVAGPYVAVVDPQLELRAGAGGVHLEAPGEARSRRLDRRRVRQYAAPAERIDDERCTQLAAVGVHGEAVAACDGGGLELGLGGVGLRVEQRAQLAVVERRERPGQLPARGAIRGMHDELREGLAQRAEQVHRLEPQGRHRAGRGLTLTQLVAIDHEHAHAGARQLARDRESCERRAAHEHVAIAGLVQAGALGSPLGRARRHLRPS